MNQNPEGQHLADAPDDGDDMDTGGADADPWQDWTDYGAPVGRQIRVVPASKEKE